MSVRNFLFLGLLALAQGCSSSVVAGACAEGFESCAGQCVAAGTCVMMQSECPKGPAPVVETDAGSACAAPKAVCGSNCVEIQTDRGNCGACGSVCNGVCEGGTCRDRSGDVVVIGFDYAAPVVAASSDLVANAVFIPKRGNLRVLSFETSAEPAAVIAVKNALDAQARISGRTYDKTVAVDAADLAKRISMDSFDVVLVFDQSLASAGSLAGIGRDLRAKIATFTGQGGTVVVLDGGRGTGEMPLFVSAAGIADISAHQPTNSSLRLRAPGDIVGNGSASEYTAPLGTVSFTLGDSDSPLLINVVEDPTSGQPVVLHRIVRK